MGRVDFRSLKLHDSLPWIQRCSYVRELGSQELYVLMLQGFVRSGKSGAVKKKNYIQTQWI